MCFIQFMNQREKLTLDSWILNESLDSLHFLVTFQEKAFILLSIEYGNENKVVHFAYSFSHFVKKLKLIEIISNAYCFGNCQYSS